MTSSSQICVSSVKEFFNGGLKLTKENVFLHNESFGGIYPLNVTILSQILQAKVFSPVLFLSCPFEVFVAKVTSIRLFASL